MSLDRKARVIYSGSFSKVFSPLLRLGYIVVPKALAERFRAERLAHGAPPSLMAQPALCEFMTSGAFAIHIRRMRRIYAARREALIEALEGSKRFTIDASPSGLMLMLRLKPERMMKRWWQNSPAPALKRNRSPATIPDGRGSRACS